MSSYQSSNPLINPVETRYDDTHRLLGEGQGAGFLPSFLAPVSNLVNQNIVANTTGGAGKFAFGMLNTPSAAMLNWQMGWDPQIHLKPDAAWTEKDARNVGVPQAMMAGVMYLGGQDLLEDIYKTSVSRGHFMQRLHEAEVIASSTYAISEYDRNSNILTYGASKVNSALINYIGSDPTTAVSLIVTGGLGSALTAAKVGAGVSRVSQTLSLLGRAGGVGTQVNNFAAKYQKTWKAATYLWDATDGASSAYSSWDQIRNDNNRLYGGDSNMAVEPWTTSVLLSAGLGAAFAGAFDLSGALFKPRADSLGARTGGISSLESIAAGSPAGTRGTPADHVSLSTWRAAKSRLEVALDSTEAPDSKIRALLMDDDLLEQAGWGGASSMDELSDFIGRHKPSSVELQEFIGQRELVRNTNLHRSLAWNTEVNLHVQGGGDPAHFWRSKAHTLLKQHMGEDFAPYRHIIDFFENQGYNPEQVARWMAHSDKEGVLRAYNGINAASRISALETEALEEAIRKMRFIGEVATQDAFDQAGNRLLDHARQGRWSAAVQIANELWAAADQHTDTLLTSITSTKDELNATFSKLTVRSSMLVDSHESLLRSLAEYETALMGGLASSSEAQRLARSALDPNATNADVLTLAGQSLRRATRSEASSASTQRAAIKAKLESHSRLLKEQAALEVDVSLHQADIAAAVGPGALDKTVQELGTFPLWNAELAEAAFTGARNAAIGHTKAGNLWKVRFVDNFLGSGSADNAMRSGEFPTRPTLLAEDPLKPMSPEDQNALLAHELKLVEPEIAAVKEAATNVTLLDKIASTELAVESLAESIKKQTAFIAGRTHPGQKAANAEIAEKLIKKQKLLTRLEGNIKRLKGQLEGNTAVVDAPLTADGLVSTASLRAAKLDVQAAANTDAGAKLAALPVDKFATPAGRKIRNEARFAAAEVGSDTRFRTLTNLDNNLDESIAASHSNIAALQAAGHTDASDTLKAARAELTYLEKEAKKVKQHLADINGRPTQVRRAHALNSSTPSVADVTALTRLRSALETAVSTGNKAEAARLQAQIYSEFGDATRLPRWPALEEFLNKQARDAADGKPTELLLSVKMNGRRVEILVASAPRGDVAERLGVADEMGAYGGDPSIHPSRKTVVDGPHLAADEQAAKRRMEQQLISAVTDDPTNIAARELDLTERTVRTEILEPTEAGAPPAATASTASTASTSTSSVPKGTKSEAKGTKSKAKVSGPDEQQQAILASLTSEGAPGERLLITNAILRAIGSVPQLRAFGRTLFALQGAGTGFGTAHNLSRTLDAVVSAFNMLDRPEALVRSLGGRIKNCRTLQNFRGQAQLAVTEVGAVYNAAVRDNHWTAASNDLVNIALDTGVTTGLNAGETAVFNAIRRHYVAAGEALNTSHGRAVALPNYRAREANQSLFNHRDQAAVDFRNTYRANIVGGANPIPDELLDTLGLPRGTNWSALTPAQQADPSILAALDAYCVASGNESIKRITGSVTEDGIGLTRHAGRTASSTSARTLDDAVRNDPNISQWFIASPIDNFKRYMEVRAPAVMFNAQLTEIFGTPTTFNDFIAALKLRTVDMPPALAKEYEAAIHLLEEKWKYATGRAQYNPDLHMDAFFRIGTGLVRGAAGGFWGLAGVATEVPRAIAAARMYGGTIRAGMMDAMRYIARSNDPELMSDIAHSVDQYSSFAHSTHGQSIGTTVVDRFVAPWERVHSVVRGREAITTAGSEYGTVVGTAIATAEALGETAMRAGGMHYFSGMARCIADRQAKRFISRNITALVDLAGRLDGIGVVAEGTPDAIARFKLEAAAAGIPYDVAIQLNHNGMLTPAGIRNLQAALEGQDEVFNLHTIRGAMNDQSFSGLMDYMQAVHAYAVPVTSLASSVQAGSALEKYFYMLTSYSRSFATGVAFRTAANGSWQAVGATFAAVAIGENIYQTLRSIAVEKESPESISQKWEANPSGMFMLNTVKSPYLGAHHSSALSLVDKASGGLLNTQTRGGNLFTGTMDAAAGASELVYGKGAVSDKVWDTFKTHMPIVNTWHSRLLIGGQLDQ